MMSSNIASSRALQAQRRVSKIVDMRETIYIAADLGTPTFPYEPKHAHTSVTWSKGHLSEMITIDELLAVLVPNCL